MTKTQARRETTKSLRAGNRYKKLSWRTLGKIYDETNRPTVRALIKKEARYCGYDINGLVR